MKCRNLNEITLPNGWAVLPFQEAIRDATSGNHKVKMGAYKEKGNLAVIDQGQEYIGGYIDDVSLACKEELPCILFGDHTRIFKYVEHPFALGADGVKVLVPKQGFDKKYLFHYFKTIRLPENAGYSRHFKFLKEHPILMPPIEEQKRIAAILDKADAIRRKRQQAIKLADDFLRATFLDMFGDPLNDKNSIKKAPIGNMGKVTTGNTPSREHPEYYGSHIEWIKSENLNTPSHIITRAKEFLSESGARIGRIVPAKSILVTCIAGTPECIGNVALADRKVAFNQQINAITPYEETNPYFLYAQLAIFKKLVQMASTNSMKGMVSKSKFEEILVLDPSIEQQNKFGAFFEKYLFSRNKMEAAVEESETLFKSLSQRAFKGEL